MTVIFWGKPFNEFRNLRVIPSSIVFRNKKTETLTITRDVVRPPFFTLGLGLSTQGNRIGAGVEIGISALSLSADIGQFSPFYGARLRIWEL